VRITPREGICYLSCSNQVLLPREEAEPEAIVQVALVVPGEGAIAQGRVAALLVRPVEPAPWLKEGNKVGESSRRNREGTTLPAE
jgi:hypothetical protein